MVSEKKKDRNHSIFFGVYETGFRNHGIKKSHFYLCGRKSGVKCDRMMKTLCWICLYAGLVEMEGFFFLLVWLCLWGEGRQSCCEWHHSRYQGCLLHRDRGRNSRYIESHFKEEMTQLQCPGWLQKFTNLVSTGVVKGRVQRRRNERFLEEERRQWKRGQACCTGKTMMCVYVRVIIKPTIRYN